MIVLIVLCVAVVYACVRFSNLYCGYLLYLISIY